MNCKQAKEISIVNFLYHQRMEPIRYSNKEYWYLSPFRNEKTASFKVFADERHWIDHATGQRGDIIKLIVIWYRINESQALQLLSNQGNSESFSFSPAKNNSQIHLDQPIIIDSLKPLQNKVLIQYAESRKIPYSIARKYTQEAYYHISDKRYFSIAFKNDSGGFELRNKYPGSKICISPKQITTIEVPGSNRLNLFEGFFDFLSALAYYHTSVPAHTTIVLNSLSNLPAVLSFLTNYEKICLYLDNDPAGSAAAEKIRSIHQDTENKSAILYPGDKDFNDFLIHFNKGT